jgi:hypothetical protein
LHSPLPRALTNKTSKGEATIVTAMSEWRVRLFDWFAQSGKNVRLLWNGVPHDEATEHPEDKNWAESEPDPNAP